jgi:hypothetical protein
MNRQQLLDLAERVERSVKRLANTPMELSLADWGHVASPLLEAADALRARAQEARDE